MEGRAQPCEQSHVRQQCTAQQHQSTPRYSGSHLYTFRTGLLLLYAFIMHSYQYSRLNENTKEIRLLTLLPGCGEDELCISLAHVPLLPPNSAPDATKLSVVELQSTLPLNWKARETLEG